MSSMVALAGRYARAGVVQIRSFAFENYQKWEFEQSQKKIILATPDVNLSWRT